MIAGIIYAIGGFIVAVIGLRFALRLLGANPASPFVNWVYGWSTPFVTPFAGMFGQDATVAGEGVVTTSVFDWTALIALIIVGIILAALGKVFTRQAV
jgi:YggT family protein